MKKRFMGLLAAVLMVVASCVPVMAEETKDFTAEDKFDFCVYNMWSTDQNCVEPTVATINSIEMTITISDYVGDPVDVRLYNRETTTWATWSTDAQTITGDGTYTFYLDLGENAYDVETIATIYIKDIRTCDPSGDSPEDAAGENLDASGVSAHVVLDSCKFNQAPTALTDSEETIVDETQADAAADTAADTAAADTVADNATTAATNTNSGNSFFPLPGLPIIGGVVVVAAVVVVIVLVNKKKNA